MGSFFTDLLSFNHDVAVLEKDPRRMRFIYNAQRFTSPEEIADFRPELLINCVTLNATLQAFEEVFPYLPKECIISDIASVKTGLQEFYEKSGFRYVSTHPMFGPTFANLGNLQTENAIIIKESDHMGKIFFKDLYGSLKLNVCEYTFEGHDEVVAYSLSGPFASTLVFASIMKHQDAPGTTFTSCFHYRNRRVDGCCKDSLTYSLCSEQSSVTCNSIHFDFFLVEQDIITNLENAY